VHSRDYSGYLTLHAVFQQEESASAYLCFSISALISSGGEEEKAR
jgi:hypothetical protein